MDPVLQKKRAYARCGQVRHGQLVKQRAAQGLYTPPDGKPMEIHIGVNRKRQINVYDPDGTRIELMEPNTVDGKPAPDSATPVPHPQGH
jgi:hypothetical protein